MNKRSVCAKKPKRRQLFLTIDRAKMASPSNESALLDMCHSRVKNYAESKHRTASKDKTNPEFLIAAVLVPIYLKEGSLHTLLTLRSEQLPTHKGQVAFPGGKQEDDDKDIVATALREAHEEVGLHPEMVEVIAVLHPALISRAREKNMYVYPVVGIVKSQFDLVINSSEVQTTFEVPLEFFLLKATHRRNKMTFKGKIIDIHLFDYETSDYKHDNKFLKFIIWGLTASICLRVAMVVLNKLPDFELEEHYAELMQYITELNTQESDFKPLSRI
ncbi:uncharacterized protein LOC144649579 [Oculina patagonica]